MVNDKPIVTRLVETTTGEEDIENIPIGKNRYICLERGAGWASFTVYKVPYLKRARNWWERHRATIHEGIKEIGVVFVAGMVAILPGFTFLYTLFHFYPNAVGFVAGIFSFVAWMLLVLIFTNLVEKKRITTHSAR